VGKRKLSNSLAKAAALLAPIFRFDKNEGLAAIGRSRGRAANLKYSWPAMAEGYYFAFSHSGFGPPGYHDCLRRFSALLLLFVFGLSLLSPLFGSDGDSNLPECCRRAGKHHCSMASESGTQGSPSNPAWRNNGRCPFYPGFATGTFPALTAVLLGIASAAALAAKRTSCNSFELRVLSSLRLRAHGKRGPPVFV
jgi:hypothetical protein